MIEIAAIYVHIYYNNVFLVNLKFILVKKEKKDFQQEKKTCVERYT